jgi:hypothetical protein
MRPASLVACSTLLLGCLGKPEEGRTLGDDLGSFEVRGVQQSSTCGKGALGSEEEMLFDIELSREASELFWDEKASGRIGSNGVFSVSVPVTFPISDPKPPDKGCTMYRLDTIDGTLLYEPGEPNDILGLSGTMSFEFAPGKGQSCSQLIGVEGGFRTLPCTIAYDLDGVRTREPE